MSVVRSQRSAAGRTRCALKLRRRRAATDAGGTIMNASTLRLTTIGLVGLFILVVSGIIYWSGAARATPAFQFGSTIFLSRVLFEAIDVKTISDMHKVELRT
jgi:hypothetical protein